MKVELNWVKGLSLNIEKQNKTSHYLPSKILIFQYRYMNRHRYYLGTTACLFAENDHITEAFISIKKWSAVLKTRRS